MSRAPWPQHKKIDFSQVDWSRSNKEIASQIRCSESHVASKRPAAHRRVRPGNPFKPRRPYRRTFDFTGVNWRQPNPVIAQQLGCTTGLVSHRRPRSIPAPPMPKPTPPPAEKRRREREAFIAQIDRTQTVEQNAKRLKVKYTKVYNTLHDAGIKLPRSRRPTKINIRRYRWSEMSNYEIAEKAGVCPQAVSYIRKAYNLPRYNRLLRWQKIDPKKTIAENAQWLGVKYHTVYALCEYHGIKVKKNRTGRPRSRSPLTPAQ
jgi:hypothetical protein